MTLGELLQKRRTAHHLGKSTLSRKSGVSITRLDDVERGRHDLTEEELHRLLKAYGAGPRRGMLRRLLVEVDLGAGTVALRSARASLGTVPLADRNLLSYLLLLHEHRDLEPGVRLPLTSVDLTLLRPALAIRRSEVAVQLTRLTARVPERLPAGRSLIAVAAAGLAVAAGAVILIPQSSGPEANRPLPATTDGSFAPPSGSSEVFTDPVALFEADDGRIVMIHGTPVDAEDLSFGRPNSVEPQIGTALVMERPSTSAGGLGADDSLPGEPSIDGRQTAATGGLRPEIGTALVVERTSIHTPAAVDPSDLSTRGPPDRQASSQKESETP